MVLPARRLTELNTWRGPTRSSSSTGGTTTTMIRRWPEAWRRKRGFLDAGAMRPLTMRPRRSVRKRRVGEWRVSADLCRESTCRPPIGCLSVEIMKHRWLGIVVTVLVVATVLPARLVAQTDRKPYARIATLRPHDGDTVDFEAGY